MMLRIVLNILLGVSVLAMPWWVGIFVILIMLFLYRAYEVLAWALIADALYGWPLPALFNTPLLFTILVTFLFFATEYGKRFLVFYQYE